MALSQDIFDKAKEVVNLSPLPPDWMAQLDRIRKTVPKKDRHEFDMFYEAGAARTVPE